MLAWNVVSRVQILTTKNPELGIVHLVERAVCRSRVDHKYGGSHTQSYLHM